MWNKLLYFLLKNGPVYKSLALPYGLGNRILRKLVKSKWMKAYRREELIRLTVILEALGIENEGHDAYFEEYLFYNSWNNWRFHFFEKKGFFFAKTQIMGKDKFDQYIHEGKKVFLLYRHTFMTLVHGYFVKYCIDKKTTGVSVGSTHLGKYLLLNNQLDLPAHVYDQPWLYKSLIRRNQLKKVMQSLKEIGKPTVINYFFDGQESKSFYKGQIAGLHYELSTSLGRFIQKDVAFTFIEPFLDNKGNLTLKIGETLSFDGPSDLTQKMARYFERTFLDSLPKLNEHMIAQLIKKHRNGLENKKK